MQKVLGDVIGKLILRSLSLDEVDDIAPGFRRFWVSGATLAGATVLPGDKVQVFNGLAARTYTPFAFDPQRAALSLFAYTHGDGPGARWTRSAARGDALRVFGPRRSLALASLAEPVLLVGDETSFAVARSLWDTRAGERCAFAFEASHVGPARDALAALALPSDGLVARRDDDAHVAELEARVGAALDKEPGTRVVLTGNAKTIKVLRSALKRRAGPHPKPLVKAYWAAGKRGLD